MDNQTHHNQHSDGVLLVYMNPELVPAEYVEEWAPRPMTPLSAGFDICACEKKVIRHEDGFVAVETGVHVKLPPGTYGRVAPRSGLAFRNHVTVGAGVIDPDYRGTIKVLLAVVKPGSSIVIEPGQRIAQLIVEKISFCDVELIDTPLVYSTPDHKGFGSTGK